MYVGVTRAMQKLYVSWAASRYRFGDVTVSTRSRFLDEIDSSLLRQEGDLRSPAGARGIPGREHAGMPGRIGVARRKPRVDDGGSYFSDRMPDYEGESQVPNQVQVGTRVVHETFGAGSILSIDGRGENARAIVEFDSVGRKHLLLKFANLRPK